MSLLVNLVVGLFYHSDISNARGLVTVLKGASKLIEYDGEKYITVSEVAKRLKVSRCTCNSNVLPVLTACYLPGKKRAVYKQSEVEELSQVRVVEKQPQPLTLIRKVAP